MAEQQKVAERPETKRWPKSKERAGVTKGSEERASRGPALTAAEALLGELTDEGHTASAFRGDVSGAAPAHELVDAVVAEFGGLDILVSTAGVEHFGALETITQADFDLLFQTNVAGQLVVT